MNRSKDMNTFGVSSNKVKVTKYPDTDTRYGFMIQDSDEYNTRIYPLGMEEKCRSKGPKYDGRPIPQAVGCVGERYENCIDLKKFDKEFVECDFSVYAPVDDDDMLDVRLDSYSRGRKNTKKFVPKKLNNNSFVDKTRLSKILYPNLKIDRSPDTSPYEKKESFNVESQKINKEPEILEHCAGLGISGNGMSCCGVDQCSGICKPLMSCCGCPSWVSPEYSCCLCILLILICIFLPCIMSCCGICAVI